jgi:hypothetical protein
MTTKTTTTMLYIAVTAVAIILMTTVVRTTPVEAFSVPLMLVTRTARGFVGRSFISSSSSSSSSRTTPLYGDISSSLELFVESSVTAQQPALPSTLSILHVTNFDSTIYIAAWGVVALIMTVNNYINYRNLPQNKYVPMAAWTRSFLYFSCCQIFAAASGTTETLLNQPTVTIEQLNDPWWQLGAIFCTIYISVAYWGLWSRMTLTFDRKLYLGWTIFFGLVWGSSTGQLLLSFYHLASGTAFVGGSFWAKYFVSYSCMGLWQYIIQDYWWDVYISPEHDSPRSIIIKTAACHVPNVALCLAFLCRYDNYAVFVGFQTLALVAAAIFQKFPAPSAQGNFDAPMTQPSLFGLPRGMGYKEEIEDRNDLFALEPSE